MCGEFDSNPILPRQAAVTTAMTSEGAMIGPSWTTVYIPIERPAGQPLEARNRTAIC
jgi:hypothetical protein